MKTKQKETLQVFRRSDLDNLFSKNGHVESGTDMLIKGECCAASEVTVVYCGRQHILVVLCARCQGPVLAVQPEETLDASLFLDRRAGTTLTH